MFCSSPGISASGIIINRKDKMGYNNEGEIVAINVFSITYILYHQIKTWERNEWNQSVFERDYPLGQTRND